MASRATTRSGKQGYDTDRVLQRMILPRDSDPLDVRPLYVDEPAGTHSHVAGRREVVVPASARVSFASLFNAFPACYWKRWTKVNHVTLRMTVRGAGRVEVYRSKLGGDIAHVTGEAVHQEDGPRTLEFPVDLAPFEDGGWIWFDVFTDDTPLEVADAAWLTDRELPRQRVAVGTTTFNRVDDCVATLLALSEDPAVLEVVSRVYVADQGTEKISSHPRFTEAAARLAGRLEVI
ncbi:MAG TPA: glycosyltransferase family 2 protein, partial [Actinophytocola sp.]